MVTGVTAPIPSRHNLTRLTTQFKSATTLALERLCLDKIAIQKQNLSQAAIAILFLLLITAIKHLYHSKSHKMFGPFRIRKSQHFASGI